MLKMFLKKKLKKDPEKETEELKLQLKQMEDDIKFLMDKMVVISKVMTNVKKNFIAVSNLIKETNESIGLNQQELQLQEHKFEEVSKTFEFMHRRLQGLEGYYIDKPLKDKTIVN